MDRTTANTRRSPGPAHSPGVGESQGDDAPAAPLARRDRLLIVGCAIVLAALAWGYLVSMDRQMAAAAEHDAMMRAMGMSADIPGATGILFLFAMWSVMMVAMMAGPAIPMLLLFASAHVMQRGGARLPAAVVTFGIGYAVVWLAFSACAALAQWALHQAALLSPAMAAANPRLGGIVLCAAGLYQFTPLKTACLRRCRSPLGFLMTRWHGGRIGALRMGARYGLHCLGCCWALMGMLFAVGVMNLLWVAALMLLVLLEKVAPAGVLLSRIAGVAAIAAGIAWGVAGG